MLKLGHNWGNDQFDRCKDERFPHMLVLLITLLWFLVIFGVRWVWTR